VAIRRWTDNRSTHLRNLRRPDSLATGRYLYVHTCAYLLSYSLPAKTMPRIYCSTNILRVMVQCLAVKRRKDGRILSILKQSADDGQTNSINFETICLAVERRTEPTHLRNRRRPDSLATGTYLYVHTCAYLLSSRQNKASNLMFQLSSRQNNASNLLFHQHKT
jgi:hypothetical protein